VDQPFTFRLERVRSLRERAEEQAREELARGLGVRLRSEALLSQAAASVAAARHASMDTALRGASARDLIAAQAFIERTELDRQAAALDLDRQDAEVESRRTALALAARDREVIERLERRKRAEHAAECAWREQVELDEIALAVHRRGKVMA
jgi:flagellar export protein FliJ